MEHSFNVEVAKIYGVEEAVLINNFYYWLAKNKANEKHYHDNRYWTYNTAKALSELFPYISESKMYRTLKHLEDEEILLKGNFNKSKMDRTCWYSFTDKGLEMLKSFGYASLHNEAMQFSKMKNAINENERAIPNIITDNDNTNVLSKGKKGFDLSFVDDSFLAIIQEWLEYKKQRKETYKSERSVKVCYNNLLKLSGNDPQTAKEIIYQSMANNWAGLFPLKNNNYGTNKNNYTTKREVNQEVFTAFMRDTERLNQGEDIYNLKPGTDPF